MVSQDRRRLFVTPLIGTNYGDTVLFFSGVWKPEKLHPEGEGQVFDVFHPFSSRDIVPMENMRFVSNFVYFFLIRNNEEILYRVLKSWMFSHCKQYSIYVFPKKI